MKNEFPSNLFCPGCASVFANVGSAGFELNTREACDVFEAWRAGYGYREDEGRRSANGFQEESRPQTTSTRLHNESL